MYICFYRLKKIYKVQIIKQFYTERILKAGKIAHFRKTRGISNGIYELNDDGLEDLEKEVICLRELLSHLKIEEASLLKGVSSPVFMQEENKLQKERILLQKRRKTLLLEKILSEETPEVATFLDQISSLKEKIADQRKLNHELKKRSPFPLQKIDTKRKVKKKPLLLEDQNA